METSSQKIEQGPHKFLVIMTMRGSSRKVYGDGMQNKSAPPLAREPKFNRPAKNKRRANEVRQAVRDASKVNQPEGVKRETTRHDCGSFPEFYWLQP
jgi:hypothetical protein